MRRRKLPLMPVAIFISWLFVSNKLWSEEPAVNAPRPLPPIATDAPTPAGKISPEELIRQALAKTIELKFEETPLEKVVETLHEKLHINILLDKKCLSEAGIDNDTPVTFSISNISGKSALALILRDLGLSAVVWHEILLITTPEEADIMLEIRVYDVADLVCPSGSNNEQADYDSLITLITGCVRPCTWDSVGGPGSIAPFDAAGIKAVILSQTLEVHEEAANLLAQLRAIRRDGNKNQTPGVAHATGDSQPAAISAKKSPFTPEEKRIRHLLSLPLALQFKETPLKKIAEYIHNNTNIQVVLDNKKLAELNVDGDTPSTVDLVGLDLRDALDSMLKEKKLGWTISKGILLITSPDEVDGLLETRTYDVSDLPAFRSKQGEPVPDYDNLIETITSTIMPLTWSSVGGPGSIKQYETKGIQALVVNQQWKAHQKIDKLLSDLRNLRKSAPTKEDIEKLPLPPPPKEKPNKISGLATPIPSLPPLVPDAKRDAVVQGNNQFAFELYSQLREKSQENLFFSPYSLSTAFAMVYTGARGATAAEMANTMRFALPQEELPMGFQALIDALPDEDNPGCRLLAANRLWCEKSAVFREPFLTTLQNHFLSDLGLVDFRQPDITRNTINDWVKEKTNQKIKELFRPGSINPKLRMVLTNAIYFKGNWAQPFDKSATQQKPFYAMNKEIMAQMMYRRGIFLYAQNNEMQILEKPYLGNCLSMVMLLPKEPEALPELEKSLTAEKFKEWSRLLMRQEVEVYLPRFKMDTNYDMIPSLRSMGIKNAFDPKAADFTGIIAKNEQIWLNLVVHCACVQVDEEGTEAVAATGIGGFGGPPSIPVFRANHPFVFLIRDMRSDSILFMGRVMAPQSN